MTDNAQIVVICVSISELKEETMTHGMPYKFSLLNQSIISSLWEIGNSFFMKYPNLVTPVQFERSFRGPIKDGILNIEDPKS